MNFVEHLSTDPYILELFPKMKHVCAWAFIACKEKPAVHGLTLLERTAFVLYLLYLEIVMVGKHEGTVVGRSVFRFSVCLCVRIASVSSLVHRIVR